jgi:hypothetical protein
MNQSKLPSSTLLSRSGPGGKKHSQGGIILVITLFCLVIMLVSAIALIRSSDASVVLLGNLGFKRDLINQGEIGVQKVYAAFNNVGAPLITQTSRLSNAPGSNYSTCVLPSDSRGIPLLLEDDANFGGTVATDLNSNPVCAGAVAMSSNDITNLLGVTVRYVVDRLCTDNQVPSSTNCVTDNLGHDQGGSNNEQKPGGAPAPIYRISIRVRGPHNTATYIQSTFTD